ncbi:unnamed protein product, partial [Prorocentrum cordatum]
MLPPPPVLSRRCSPPLPAAACRRAGDRGRVWASLVVGGEEARQCWAETYSAARGACWAVRQLHEPHRRRRSGFPTQGPFRVPPLAASPCDGAAGGDARLCRAPSSGATADGGSRARAHALLGDGGRARARRRDSQTASRTVSGRLAETARPSLADHVLLEESGLCAAAAPVPPHLGQGPEVGLSLRLPRWRGFLRDRPRSSLVSAPG